MQFSVWVKFFIILGCLMVSPRVGRAQFGVWESIRIPENQTLPGQKSPAGSQALNTRKFGSECEKVVQAQLTHGHKALVSIIRSGPGIPSGFAPEDIRFYCDHQTLLWNVSNYEKTVIDRNSPFCNCLHASYPVEQPSFDSGDCLNQRFNRLATEAHFAAIAKTEGPLQCLNGDLVRGKNQDSPNGKPDFRLLESQSPFCQCPQTNCEENSNQCTDSQICLGGMCRAGAPVCDRQCITDQRNNLEKSIQQTLQACSSPPCSRKQIYIAPEGSDTDGDGSQSRPFKSLHHGLNNLNQATTVILAPGTYVIEPVKIEHQDLEIVGSDRDSTMLRAKYYPDYNKVRRLFFANQARVVLKNLSFESLKGPNPQQTTLFKISHAFSFYNSKVILENLNLDRFDSNQFFGLFNSTFRMSKIKMGENGYQHNGDLVVDIVNSQGIVEDSRFLNTPTGGANMDHTISAHTLAVKTENGYMDPKLFLQTPPNRLIIRGNVIMSRKDSYGDGIRLVPSIQESDNEFYVYDNIITKVKNWKKDIDQPCWGVRILVTHNSIVEFRNNKISEFCKGFSLQGDPIRWDGAMLFENNQIFDNVDVGLEIGGSAGYRLKDLGKNPFAFIDFGGGMMGSQGGNSFYGNGKYDVHYRLNSDLYIRKNYWGTENSNIIRIKKDVPSAKVWSTPIRNRSGEIRYELENPPNQMSFPENSGDIQPRTTLIR